MTGPVWSRSSSPVPDPFSLIRRPSASRANTRWLYGNCIMPTPGPSVRNRFDRPSAICATHVGYAACVGYGFDPMSDSETSIRRGIEVLLSLASDEAVEQGGLGVTRISERLEREKSQVSRALKALAEYGLVERNRDALTYRLGWRIYALAQLAGEPRVLEEAAPRLRRLAAETQERAHFSVLQGSDVLTLLSESPGRAVEA